MNLGLSPTSKPSPARAGGVWRFDGETVYSLARWEVGPKVVLTPSRSTRLLALDLPAKSARDRALALPFAFEDILAEPLEASAFAIGAPLTPGRYLVAATAKAVLNGWVARLDSLGLQDAVLAPEALMLPVPALGQWSLALIEAQAIVRTDDGGGFAIGDAHLDLAWIAAERPAIVLFGAGDTSLPIASREALAPHLTTLTRPMIDLRQGASARALPVRRRLAQLAAVALVALMAHAAVAAAEGYGLQRLAKARRSQAITALQAVSPTTGPNADLISELDALTSPGAADSFTSLLTKTAQALSGLPSPLRLRALAFDAREGSLTLSVETADLGQLQRVNNALLKAGLNASTGAASLQDSVAVGDVIIREAAS